MATLQVLEAETGAPVRDRRGARRAAPEQPRPRVRRPLRARTSPPRGSDRFRELYVVHGVPGTHLLPGARASRFAAVRELSGRAIVITAKYEPNAIRCLEQVGLDVDAVVFGWRYAVAKGRHPSATSAPRSTWATRPNDVRAAGTRRRRTWSRSRRVRTRRPKLQAAGAATVLDSLADFPGLVCAGHFGALARATATATGPQQHHDREHHEQGFAIVTRITRVVSSTECRRGDGFHLPRCAPSPRSCPRGSSTLTVSPNESRRSASKRLVDRTRVDALHEQRPHDVLVGRQPGLEILSGRRCPSSSSSSRRCPSRASRWTSRNGPAVPLSSFTIAGRLFRES